MKKALTILLCLLIAKASCSPSAAADSPPEVRKNSETANNPPLATESQDVNWIRCELTEGSEFGNAKKFILELGLLHKNSEHGLLVGVPSGETSFWRTIFQFTRFLTPESSRDPASILISTVHEVDPSKKAELINKLEKYLHAKYTTNFDSTPTTFLKTKKKSGSLLGRVCKKPQSLMSGDKLGMQKRVILKPSLEKALPKLVSIIETIERKIPY